MAKSPMNTGLQENVTASLSKVGSRHIRAGESDAIERRIKEVVGDESVSSFARRCGFGESLLRKYLAGSIPNAQNLAAISSAGGVTVDWLATGRPPKERNGVNQHQAQYRVASEPPPAVAAVDPALLRQCLSACAIAYSEPFTASSVYIQLEHAAAFYNALVSTLGARMRLEDLARLESRDLAAQLRLFTQAHLLRPFEPAPAPADPQDTDAKKAGKPPAR